MHTVQRPLKKQLPTHRPTLTTKQSQPLPRDKEQLIEYVVTNVTQQLEILYLGRLGDIRRGRVYPEDGLKQNVQIDNCPVFICFDRWAGGDWMISLTVDTFHYTHSDKD